MSETKNNRTARLEVRTTPQQLAILKAAAEFDGLPFSSWVRVVLLDAARKALLPWHTITSAPDTQTVAGDASHPRQTESPQS